MTPATGKIVITNGNGKPIVAYAFWNSGYGDDVTIHPGDTKEITVPDPKARTRLHTHKEEPTGRECHVVELGGEIGVTIRSEGVEPFRHVVTWRLRQEREEEERRAYLQEFGGG